MFIMGDELNFNFDGKKDVFEDIVSDSSRIPGNEEQIPFSEIGNKHAKKKKKCLWKRMSVAKRILAVTLSVVILLIGVVVVNPFHIMEHIIYNYQNITEKPEDLGFENKIDNDIINIALFGIDTRNKNTFKGNSDSIMILSLNTKLKTVKIMSVMRDTIVPIVSSDGKRRYSKINSAYAKDPETAIRTLNSAFDLDISEYATVNFYGMSEIIDAVGGVDITVTEDELKWKGYDHPNLNNCMDEICANLGVKPNKYYIHAAGDYHVNGIQAVAYSRVRNCRSVWGTNNDYGRTDRQRHVMEQLFNKALTIKKSDYAKLAKALIPCTKTSLELSQILGLAYNILLDKPTFYQARIPQDDWQMPFRWSGYGSVVYYDLEFAKNVIHSVIYENKTVEEYIELNGVKKNDWFASVGGRVKSNTDTTSSKQTVSTDTPSNVSSDTESSAVSSEDSSDTSSQNTSSQDTSSQDASSQDTSSQNTSSQNTSSGTQSGTPSQPETPEDGNVP